MADEQKVCNFINLTLREGLLRHPFFVSVTLSAVDRFLQKQKKIQRKARPWQTAFDHGHAIKNIES